MEAIMMRSARFSHLSIPLSAAIALTLAAPPAVHAEIKALTVLAAKDIGPFHSKGYREVEARMEGTAPGGAYAVPVTLAFPKEAFHHNGFAIVDVINTVTIGKEQFVIGGGRFPSHADTWATTSSSGRAMPMSA
jgi:hypothetical protein